MAEPRDINAPHSRGLASEPMTQEGPGAKFQQKIDVDAKDKSKGPLAWLIVLALLLAGSVAVNATAFLRFNRNDARVANAEYRVAIATGRLAAATEALEKAKRDYATELQLRRYDLDDFKAGKFAELDTKVRVLERTTLFQCIRSTK